MVQQRKIKRLIRNFPPTILKTAQRLRSVCVKAFRTTLRKPMVKKWLKQKDALIKHVPVFSQHLFTVLKQKTHSFVRTYIPKQFFNPKSLRVGVASLLLGILVLQLFLPTTQNVALAGTATFVQSSWAGGVSSTAVASDPANRTGWNYFNTSTNLDFTSTTAVRLTSSTYSFTDDTTATTTGRASGGGFANGSFNGTSFINSNANIVLATSSQILLNEFDVPLPRLTSTVKFGNVFVTGTYAYFLQGDAGTTAQFQRLDIPSNTLTTYTSLPASIGGGSCSTQDPNYVYVVRGLATATIWRHSVTNTTAAWESITNLPGNANYNSYDSCMITDSTYLYVAQPLGTGFWRHVLSDTSSAWQSFTATPNNFGDGGSLLIDNTGTYIYNIRGAGSNGVYRHLLSDTSSAWETFSVTNQLSPSVGGDALIDNDYVYVAYNGAMRRHTLLNTSTAWELFSATGLSGPGDGGGLTTDGTYFYVSQGGTANGFFRHVVSDTSSAWQSFTPTPANVGTGGSIAYDSINGQVYILQGSLAFSASTQNYFRHTTSDTSSAWVGSNTSNIPALPSTTGIGESSGQVMDSNYIYVLQGNSSRNVYRHSLFDTSSAWETLAQIPASTGVGASISINSNYLFVAQGNTGSGFYRHSLSDTSSAWDTFAAVPHNPSAGGASIADDNYVYVSAAGGGVTGWVFRHTTANTSSAWENLTDLPACPSYGGGMVKDSTYLYILRSANSASFYRHALANTSSAWDTFTLMPSNSSASVTENLLTIDSSYVYVAQGGSTGFHRHTLANTSSAWESFAALPGSMGAGGSVAVTPNYIFVMQGNASGANGFWRHAIADTSSAWTSLPAFPTTVSTGGGLKADSTGNVVYALRGGATNDFYRYIVNQITYNASGTFTSAALSLGAAGYFNMSWTSSTPSVAGPAAVRIQVATSSDNVSYSSFVGSDGTVNTFFTGGTSSLSSVLPSSAKYFKYKLFLATSNTSFTPTFNDFTVNYRSYAATGTVISSIYNTGDPASRFASLQWTGSTTSDAQIKYQLRTASSSAVVSSSNWVGPDGTNSTYFTSANGADAVTSTFADGSNDQYMQLQTFLVADGTVSPVLNSETLTYVVNQAPQLQNVTAQQNGDGTVSISYEVRSTDTADDTGSIGIITPSFRYCAGSSCSTITALALNATSSKSVNIDGITWTTITTTWTPTIDFSNLYDANAKVMVAADDLQAANNFGYATSSAFTLDTKAPVGTTVFVDATSSLAIVTVTATDTSTLFMRLATSTNVLVNTAYSPFATTSAINLGTDPSTVYVQFTDAYSNSTTVISVTTPETPTYAIVQDTSNVLPPTQYDYRLFIAWKAVALPPQGAFGSYKVYRSTNQSSWTLLSTITDRTTNFYTDASVPSSTRVYYKIVSSDSLNNSSFSSATVNGMADGIQDYGEGGGGTAPPPVITNIATSTVSPSSFTVTWDTDTLSNSKVSYSASAGVFTNNVTVASYVNTAATIGQHQVIIAGLTPDTTYYFKVASTDAGNNTAEDLNGGDGFIVRTSPGPTITALPTVTSLSNTSALVSWETSLNANSIVYFSTSSNFVASSTASNLGTFATTHEITLSGLASNTRYYYYVASTDQSGYTVLERNVVSGAAQYYLFTTTDDNDAPTFSAFDTTVNTSSAFIIWNTDKLANSQVEYGLTTSYGSSTILDATQTVQHYVPLTGLTADTLYHYRVRSTDGNGNVGVSSDHTFTTNEVTTIPPIISSVATSSVALSQATINWITDKQTNHTVEYGTTEAYGSIAGNLYDFTSTTHSVTLTGLSGNTTYYFRANSTDQSGNNATSSQYNFVTTADVTPPVISSITQIVEQTAAIVQWTTDELTMSQVNYGLASTTLDTTVSVTSTFSMSHTLALTGLTPNTTYYFEVISADTSANTTTESVLTFTTVAYGETVRTIVSGGGGSTNAFADTSAPVISNIAVKNIDPFSALVTWMTDKEGSSLVAYGKTSAYGLLAGNEIVRVLSHSVLLFNLDPATTYHFKAESFDAAGKLGVSNDMTFTTLNAAGEVVTSTPESTKPADSATSSLKSFVLNQVKTAAADFLEDLLRSITSNPALKQIPEAAIVSTITDITQRVVSAPAIVGLRPEVQVRGNQATIGWYTDKKTDGMVSYAKHSDYRPASDNPYTASAADTSPISTVHIVDLINLEPATQYHFRVISKGEIGSETKSADFVFTTESVLPVIENVKIVAVKASSVDFSWKTNIPTVSTIVYTNLATKKISTIGDQTFLVNHVFTVPNLEPGTAYSVIIKGENEAKDIISSNPVTFTTTIDNGAPVLSSVSANSTLYPGKNSKVQTIVTWKTDEPSTSQIFYQEGVQEKGTVFSTSFDPNLTTDHIMVLTNFKPGTVYKYWAESIDGSENSSQSAIFTMLTPIQKETIIDIIGKNFQSVFGWTNQVKL